MPTGCMCNRDGSPTITVTRRVTEELPITVKDLGWSSPRAAFVVTIGDKEVVFLGVGASDGKLRVEPRTGVEYEPVGSGFRVTI